MTQFLEAVGPSAGFPLTTDQGKNGRTDGGQFPPCQRTQVAGGRFACIRPQPFVNLETGELAWVRCGATTADLCPGCAALYREDAKMIIRSGVIQHLEAGDPVSFVTLTPPGLWKPDSPDGLRKIHRYYPHYWELLHDRKASAARLRQEASRAVCGPCTEAARAARPAGTPARDVPPVRHPPQDPLGGLPVNLDAFDYQAAALWNWWLGDLWHRTVTYLRRAHGADIQYVKVLEWSRRGVPHLHALLTGAITPAQLQELIGAVNQSLPEPRQGWGDILDVRQLRIHGDPEGPLNVGRATAYLAKYLTKTSGGGLPDAASAHPHAEAHLARLSWAAWDLIHRNIR